MYSFSAHKPMLRAVLAILSFLSVSTFAAACGSDQEASFQPHPTRQSLEGKTSDAQDAPSSANNSLPTAVNINGTEVALSPPGTRLSFGEPATVVTTDSEARILVWEIKAYEGVPIDPEYIALSQPEKAKGISHYLCFLYEITYLGALPMNTEDPQVLHGLPDEKTTAVLDPVLTLGTVDGGQAKTVKGGAANYCEIPNADRLPTSESDLVPQFPYTHGLLGAVEEGVSAEAEPASVIYRFEDQLGGDFKNMSQVETITWSKK